MKPLVAICAGLALFASSAVAEEEGGKSLMEQGAELFFEGLRQEMEPTLDSLRGLAEQFGPAMQSFLEQMGPALAELIAEVEDWGAYETPEMLPNGDIIIRRKPPVSPPQDSAPEAEGETVPDQGTDI